MIEWDPTEAWMDDFDKWEAEKAEQQLAYNKGYTKGITDETETSETREAMKENYVQDLVNEFEERAVEREDSPY